MSKYLPKYLITLTPAEESEIESAFDDWGPGVAVRTAIARKLGISVSQVQRFKR